VVTEAVLSWLVSAATWVVNLVPVSRINLGDMTSAWEHFLDLSWFLPIPEVATMVLAVLGLGPALLAATLTTWLAVGVLRGGQART